MPRPPKKTARPHPGWLEERGDSFRVVLKVGGERHRYTLAGVTRSEAEEYARTKHAELLERSKRRRLGLPEATTVSALIAKFRAERLPLLSPATQTAYGSALDTFARFLKLRRMDPDVREVRSGHVADFLNWRRVNPSKGTAPLSNRTVQKGRTVLHTLFAFAEELELRDGNPVAKTKAPKADARDPVILDADQYAQLLAACGHNPMLQLFVLTMGETGARSESEVLHLQWGDVDLEEGFIRIRSGGDRRRTKTGKGRWVPMTPELAGGMREHFAAFRFARYEGRATPWIFHHQRTRRHAKAGDRVRSFRRAFENAAARAQLPADLHQHDLRHRRVTTWLAEGKNPVHVKEAVGHQDLRTTMGYTHLAREHLRALVEGDADGPRPRQRNVEG